jgi:serine/threonine protein kinase
MPSHTDILQSIQIPQLIKDTLIASGKPELDSRGRPVHYTGGFAMVFPFVVNGEKWAFRCWTADMGNMEKRLNLLSAELASLKLPYFCDFTYVPEGIVVDGKVYPTTHMRWIEGQTIKDFICTHKNDHEKLELLGKNFQALAKDMHSHHIAHGDLQHGNILVNDKLELFLIDYDSVYLQALGDQNDFINGLPEYQHPSRNKNKKATEKLDYFSELVIYISILAIAENPNLVDEYQVEGSERLLFSKEDFQDLEHSKIYQDLSKLNNDISVLLQILKQYLSKNDINDLQPLEVMLSLYSKEPEIKCFECQEGNIVYEGDEMHISWDVANVSLIMLNGKKYDGVNSIQERAQWNTSGQFTLHVSNAFNSAEAVINVTVLPVPQISFKANNKKLRKGKKESVTINWQVQKAKGVKLVIDGKEDEVELSGSKTILPQKSTNCCIKVWGLDGNRLFTKDIFVGVFTEAATSFKADRHYTLPGVPVTLSWNVENARKVELVGTGEISHRGSKEVNPSKDTDYILRVTDAFGQHDETLGIHMLPLPVIKSIQVPAPELKSKTTVVVAPPSFSCDIRMPEIKFETVDLKVPNVPSLKDAGVYVDLLNKKKRDMGLWSKLKSLFQYYNHKIKEYESSK